MESPLAWFDWRVTNNQTMSRNTRGYHKIQLTHHCQLFLTKMCLTGFRYCLWIILALNLKAPLPNVKQLPLYSQTSLAYSALYPMVTPNQQGPTIVTKRFSSAFYFINVCLFSMLFERFWICYVSANKVLCVAMREREWEREGVYQICRSRSYSGLVKNDSSELLLEFCFRLRSDAPKNRSATVCCLCGLSGRAYDS